MGGDAEQTEVGAGSGERGATRRGPASDEEATQQIPTNETRRNQNEGGSDAATHQIPAVDQDGSRRRGSGESRESRESKGRGGSPRQTNANDTQEFEVPTRPASQGEGRGGAGPSRASGGSRASRGGRASGSAGGAGAAGRGTSATSDAYSTGYSEVLRDREEYLRDIYGGVDWLASFVGFVFTLLCAGGLGVGATLILLTQLELEGGLASGQLTSNVLTGLAIIAAVIFVSFLFGGYISGRLARYDGGRNGAMVLLWTVLVAALLLALSGLFGQVISGTLLGDAVGEVLGFGTTVTDLLSGLGITGVVIAAVAPLVALLGGILGGRLGSRYHREIDYTP